MRGISRGSRLTADQVLEPLSEYLEVERVRRIELPYAAWEAAVLPLNYTRVG